MFYNTNLPPDLRVLKDEIEGYAREYGLDFYETIFEVVDADDLNEIAAYGGFPTRYPHWSFGMAYEELKKSYEYGLSKIYEMVINNDPCYAYLMRSNHTVDQKLVMAHVYGHCLAPETRIVTAAGDKRIDQVRVGDKVLTHTGQYKPVRIVAKRPFQGKIFNVVVDGRKHGVQITGEHPVAVLQGEQYVWLPARSLKGGMFVGAAHAFKDRQHIAEAVKQAHGLDWHPLAEPRTEDYHGEVYNLSVADDESYTLSAGFVVHNCDFFKNNAYFAHTSRKMMDEIANHGSRIRRYAERFGEDTVEAFIDRCMSIDDLIDIHSVAIHRREKESRYNFDDAPPDEDNSTRFKSKDYMADYLNPPNVLAKEEEARQAKLNKAPLSFPERPQKDVLLFLIEHAPLQPWQRDVLSIIRDEAYYFFPQAQTKIINEGWACVVADTLIPTSAGMLTAQELVEQRQRVQVSDGETTQAVYDWAIFRDYPTIKITTRRGLELEGSENHRVMRDDGTWSRLDALQIGDTLKLARGANVWATELVPIDWQPAQRQTMASVAADIGVDPKTIWRYVNNPPRQPDPTILRAVQEYEANASAVAVMANKRRKVRIPMVVDEKLACFLGYLIGDGHISDVKRVLGLTTGDREQAEAFAALVQDLFGLTPRMTWDDGRYRVLFSSRTVHEFLVHLGLKTGRCARSKCVPDVIRRSPAPVVAAFLRSLYDCDGYAGQAGVILSTSSTTMSQQVQTLLLNFGVRSTRRPHKDGCWHVQTLGRSAINFRDTIGFGLERKTQRLEAYITDRSWFKQETDTDEVVSITRGRADVFDMSVENTHRYVAAGFVNHNSYWHSTIMTQKALDPSELIDYADHHSGTMAMSGGRLNPYKLGIELLRDIEERWDTGRFGPEYDACDDLETKRKWNKKLGLGRKKIFEVRRIHNDITFIDTFLTPEFCVRHKLFSFGYAEQPAQYLIESREFDLIKQRLLFSLTNFGKPWIYVLNGNHRNRGELLLKHEYNGIELKLNHAHEVLVRVQGMWQRPVHLETIVDGRPTLMSWDGMESQVKAIGETDVNRKTVGKA